MPSSGASTCGQMASRTAYSHAPATRPGRTRMPPADDDTGAARVSELGADTAVVPPRGGGRTFTAVGTDGWGAGDTPNGGYLLAILPRAMRAPSAPPAPLVVTGHGGGRAAARTRVATT